MPAAAKKPVTIEKTKTAEPAPATPGKPAKKIPMKLKAKQPMKLTAPTPKVSTKQAHEIAKKAVSTKPPPKKKHSLRWGYGGAAGPDKWGSLKPSFGACSEGRRQSPINLESTEVGNLAPLKIHYKVSAIELVNNGHTIQANYGDGSHIKVGKERFDLLRFHFHTPSEHQVAGRGFPMEIQFVHRNERGQLAIVGVLVTFGKYNLAAREIWDNLPTRPGTKSANTRALINARDLLPENRDYFRYNGSLTTPPCSEGVSWFVLQTPIHLSVAQITKLYKIMGRNARPPQARNSRYLIQSTGG